MKRFVTILLPLSILLIVACKPKYVLTTTAVKPESLTQKRLLIVSYDTEVAQPMVISLKNYLAAELTGHKVEVQKINIRHNVANDSLVELEKIRTQFKPDFVLMIRVNTERSRDFYIIQAQKKFKFRAEKVESKLREASFDIAIAKCTEGGNLPNIWHSQAAFRQLSQSEQVTDVKKMVRKLRTAMQTDGLIQL